VISSSAVVKILRTTWLENTQQPTYPDKYNFFLTPTLLNIGTLNNTLSFQRFSQIWF